MTRTRSLVVDQRQGETGSYPAIGEYALLADCHSAALLSRAGSIDWACLRRFDAGSVFGRLLDWTRGGYFAVATVGPATTTRRYAGDSLVLETVARAARGTVRMLDAFAMRPGGGEDPPHELIRVAECIHGQADVEVVFEPRLDYGGLRPWIRGTAVGTWLVVGGDDGLVLRSDVPLLLDQLAARLTGSISLCEGQRVRLALTACAAHEVAAEPGEPIEGLDDRLAETIDWWHKWSAGTVADGPYEKHIRRSAAVLKGLTCAPTGAIVAAPTTSLPEEIGGVRNWDYRYCWVRDSTLALEALDAVGHREVAAGFRDFLLRSAAGHAEDLQIMYGCYGQRRLIENELELDGYRGSRPVRVGNNAASQRQLDVYGHVLDAAHCWQVSGRPPQPDEWRFLQQIVDAAAAVWEQPDQGIWEMRGAPRHFVYSKVTCWVALDRGIRLVEQFDAYEADLDAWRAARDRIRIQVDDRGVAPGGHFIQAYGLDEVDASLLKLAPLGFVDARDPRMLATVSMVRERLADPRTGFLRRYSTVTDTDGLTGAEGTFLLCTCWLVDILALQGEIAEATEVFERLLDVGNDLDLFAEEYDTSTGELLGNFPQAFTHLGIVQSALRLRAVTIPTAGTG